MIALQLASLLSVFPLLTNAATLFAAQSSGDLSTLSFDKSGRSYALSVTSNTREGGGNPSWLNLDVAQRLLYCLDRGQPTVTTGSLNSFRIGKDGVLSKIAGVEAPFSGVAAEYFDAGEGQRGYVTASYNSFSHHVILDPTRRFILIPDLGADLIRVFTYAPKTVAPLTELAPLRTESGTGPRHAAFWQAPGKNGALHLLFNGELSQKVYSYRVTYTASGLSWVKVFDAPVLGEQGKAIPPNTAPTSEIAISPDQRYVIISSRESSFSASPLFQKAASDSLATYKINADGSLSFVEVVPSGGWLPRQFSLNKKGDRVAVGHQLNNTVVIWERNIKSGKIGAKLAESKTQGPVVFVGWDE